jgi:uncharacterized protein (DUF1330 family)
MTAYVLAQIAVHDRARYDRYAMGFLATLKPFGGRLLAADEAVEVVGGDWPFQKVVLIAFEDAGTAKAWAASPEYQAISPDREASTTGVSLLVRGL